MPQPRLLIDINSVKLSIEDKQLISHPAVAGLILFQRNYASPEQLIELASAIREINPMLLIVVDQEGGRVQRFTQGFTQLPALAQIGQCYNKKPQQALTLSEQVGWLLASELLSCGVDASLAPVLDLYNERSQVIASRAFHREPSVTIKLASAMIRGMRKAGMAATGKHFPGHGNVVGDSHLESPIDTRNTDTISQQDLSIFNALSPQLAAIMPAHVIYPAFDPQPASLSPFWLQQMLRQQLAFDGLVISDDLSMQAAVDSIPEPLARMKQAYQAGIDLLLLCNDRPALLQVIDHIPLQDDPQLARRLNAMRGQFTMTPHELRKTEKWQSANKLIEGVL